MIRILITGSRTWDDAGVITRAFNEVLNDFQGQPVTLISGQCPEGADRMCEIIAQRLGWSIEYHPADWKRHGKRAGFVRNAEMVDAGADRCLAFIRNNSRGASMTRRLAEQKGIDTHSWFHND